MGPKPSIERTASGLRPPVGRSNQMFGGGGGVAVGVRTPLGMPLP
jgi:hypothetical protein